MENFPLTAFVKMQVDGLLSRKTPNKIYENIRRITKMFKK